MKMSVVVAEHEGMLRDGLVRLVNAEGDMKVIGQASDGREAVKLVEQLKPNAILMDTDLVGTNGVEATRQIKSQAGSPVVVLVSVLENPHYGGDGVVAGAAAHLGSRCTPEELIEAIRHAVSGQSPVAGTTAYAHMHRAETAGPCRLPEGIGLLTPREGEVLQLLSEGYTAKEIADTLHMSIKTVSTHRVHIGEKLNTRNLAEMTKFALKCGLVHV